jgi:hypothetical protein
MSSFQVSTENLMAASATLTVTAAPEAADGVAGTAGAAESTPAAGAWSAFAERAGAATRSSTEAVTDLAHALSMAAGAYAATEATNAGGFTG